MLLKIKQLYKKILKIRTLDTKVYELYNKEYLLNPDDIINQIKQNYSVLNYNFNGHSLYINNEDSAIYHIVNSTKKIESIVNNCNLSESPIVFDIGGNVGLFSYFIKKKYPNSTIYLFEADESLLEIINLNLKGLSNINIINKAVGSIDGKTTFYINPSSRQTNSTIKESVTPFIYDKGVINKEVETINLDNFCSANKISNIDLVKLDIQGSEFEVLDASRNILKNCNTVICEVSFLMLNTISLIKLLDSYFPKHKPICDTKMGADLLFYK